MFNEVSFQGLQLTRDDIKVSKRDVSRQGLQEIYEAARAGLQRLSHGAPSAKKTVKMLECTETMLGIANQVGSERLAARVESIREDLFEDLSSSVKFIPIKQEKVCH